MAVMHQTWRTPFIVCATVLVVAFSIGRVAYADNESEKNVGEKIQRLVDVSFAMIEKEDFDKTPALFHYPENYTEGEEKRDRCLISNSTRLITEIFGKPSNLKPQDHVGQIKHYSIYIRAGGAEYWKHRTARASTSFFADFPNTGSGVVNFQFEGLETGRPVLRSLAFGVDATSKDAKERLTKLGNAFSKRVQQIKPKCDALAEFK
ncbi:hypothetical protein ACFL2V_01670 [Pseudomonadota bacterium]